MIKELLSSRRFAPLFWAQFSSALNDNVLKNALVIMLLYGVAAEAGRLTGDGRRRGLHLPLLRAFGARRRTGRQIRQIDRRPAPEVRRDLCRLLCGRRLLHAFDPAAVRGACAVRHRRRAVRPGEIRHPARSASGRRTRDRQRAGRRRDLHGDPDRHHRRRPVRGGRLAHGLDLPCRRGAVGPVLDVCGPYSRHTAIRARPADHGQSLDLHRSSAEVALRRAAAVGRHGDRVVVLAGRRCRAVAAARAGQGRHRRHRRRRRRSALRCSPSVLPRARCLQPSSATCARISRWCRSAPS